ncbi:alpha/beta-hydrolase [Auricularia subglabra TFB-10046 SS5]|nr:alpha/beta-hydrolase [Auricularia subglabra TFB-10046 SS5]
MFSFALSLYFQVLLSGGIAAAGRPGTQTERLHSIGVRPVLHSATGSRDSFRIVETNTNSTAGRVTKADFFVSGKRIPLLKATVQDSYAGLLPITGRANETRKLFFWYWPSSAPRGSNTLSIWLNGGPGCSSLIGFLSEHGAFTFRPGTAAPSVNPYAWSTVSDVLYIEQPVGTGFTGSGPSDVKDETDVGEEFYGFLEQFYAVFPELLRKKLFLTGESYAGYYVPYIAHRILTASKSEKKQLPIDLQGLLINDGVYDSFSVSIYLPLERFVVANQATLGVNDSVVASVLNTSIACGIDAILDQVTYPPKGPLPPFGDDDLSDECFLGLEEAYEAAFEANPCLDINDIRVKCPAPEDPIIDYFSRPDVQKALHVPNFGAWSDCVGGVLRDPDGAINDPSPFTKTLFPGLIRALPRGLTLWHGLEDMNLLANGTRVTIQNLTWAGHQGFQRAPLTRIIVDGKDAGIQHSERGLTYYEIKNSGHLIPMNQPKVALEVFKTILGQGHLVHTNEGL